MHSYTLAKIWIRKGHCSVVLAALLLVLLSQVVVAATIESPEQAPGGSDCASTHTVVSGETLTGLAEGAGVSLSALAQANNLSTTDQVLIGQELCIPHTISAASTLTPSSSTTAQTTGTAAGWTGSYYNTQDLSGDAVLTRQDGAIDFDWASGSPDTTISVRQF